MLFATGTSFYASGTPTKKKYHTFGTWCGGKVPKVAGHLLIDSTLKYISIRAFQVQSYVDFFNFHLYINKNKSVNIAFLSLVLVLLLTFIH